MSTLVRACLCLSKPVRASVWRFLELGDAAEAVVPFASGLRGAKEAGIARQGTWDWLASPEWVGGTGESLFP